MKLKGREKTFWWHFDHITDSKDIPNELPGYTSIDSSDDDDFFEQLTEKVKIIHEIYLKDAKVTNAGVQYISRIQKLKKLTIKKTDLINSECLVYLNDLKDLEYLDITKTAIIPEDLTILKNLQNLKELYVSSENFEKEYFLEQAIKMKEILPNCILYINYESYE